MTTGVQRARTVHIFFAAMALLLGMRAWADSEAPNRVYVTAAPYGQFYAKSIPEGRGDTEGRTEIYQVGEPDKLIHTYPWYSQNVYLFGWSGGDVYAVQTGPWQRGYEASSEHLALAFYRNGALVKKYSTLDIAGKPNNVSRSISHYTVIREIIGFSRPVGQTVYLEVRTEDGRVLAFDLTTGAITSPQARRVVEELEDARTKISSLKYDWMRKNQATYEANKKILVTRAMLEKMAPGSFPKLPQGYRYVPSAVWAPVELKSADEGAQ